MEPLTNFTTDIKTSQIGFNFNDKKNMYFLLLTIGVFFCYKCFPGAIMGKMFPEI